MCQLGIRLRKKHYRLVYVRKEMKCYIFLHKIPRENVIPVRGIPDGGVGHPGYAVRCAEEAAVGGVPRRPPVCAAASTRPASAEDHGLAAQGLGAI